MPYVLDLISEGVVPGGTEHNARTHAAFTTFDPSVPQSVRIGLSDAQTSGGLLDLRIRRIASRRCWRTCARRTSWTRSWDGYAKARESWWLRAGKRPHPSPRARRRRPRRRKHPKRDPGSDSYCLRARERIARPLRQRVPACRRRRRSARWPIALAGLAGKPSDCSSSSVKNVPSSSARSAFWIRRASESSMAEYTGAMTTFRPLGAVANAIGDDGTAPRRAAGVSRQQAGHVVRGRLQNAARSTDESAMRRRFHPVRRQSSGADRDRIARTRVRMRAATSSPHSRR